MGGNNQLVMDVPLLLPGGWNPGISPPGFSGASGPYLGWVGTASWDMAITRSVGEFFG